MGSVFLIVFIFIMFSVITSAAKTAGKGSAARRPSAPSSQQPTHALQRKEERVSARDRAMQQAAARREAEVRGSTAQLKRSLDEKSGYSGGTIRSSSLPRDMEDRSRDWLARQLREEQRVLARGDFWDLGAAHSKSCDARAVKQQHALYEHDDSIDTGERLPLKILQEQTPPPPPWK